mmetsp:Transcript_31374/g.76340  ORF Transcript_31374/g.76340 Transcript_31374/m.76340 type:complete len:157 (-) Transcript_31374:161-631(-)
MWYASRLREANEGAHSFFFLLFFAFRGFAPFAPVSSTDAVAAASAFARFACFFAFLRRPFLMGRLRVSEHISSKGSSEGRSECIAPRAAVSFEFGWIRWLGDFPASTGEDADDDPAAGEVLGKEDPLPAQNEQARHLQNLQWFCAFSGLQKPPHPS